MHWFQVFLRRDPSASRTRNYFPSLIFGLSWILSGSRAMAVAEGGWDDRFAWSVLEGPQIHAVASRGSNVYFGGSFTTVGGASAVGSGVAATNLALWNGQHWASVGGGINGEVYALAVHGNDLYVGGEFTSAGGVNATNIARWDGTNWSALGSGTDGIVYTLTSQGEDLYAGGRFSVAGGNGAKRIAKWNGANWSAVGAGLGNAGATRAIAFVGNDLYASGDFFFQNAALSTVRTIARFDGDNWQPLAGDLGTTSDTAYALTVIGNDLYVGGTFLTAGGVPAKRIARWNGSWSAVGGGITASAVGIYTMVTDGTNLYVAGQINAAGSITTGNTAKWDGTAWSGLGIGIPGAAVVNSLALANGELFVGGAFLGIGAGVLHTYSTARWDGNSWWALGQGMDNAILALASSGTNVYAGGWFYRAGGVDAGNVATWNGNRWSSLGGANFGSQVLALAVNGSNVYVGGGFSSGLTNGLGFSALGIARWNGANWGTLGAGLRLNNTNGVVRAIAISPSGTVYAGGTFTQAGGALATNIARFQTNWQTVGTSPNSAVNGEVRALAFVGNDLYVGGDFTKAGGVDVSGLAKWDGAAWSSVGTGLTGVVMTLVTNGNDLYVGGAFTNAAAGATNIAKWNGSAWAALGSGVGGHTGDVVAALAVKGNEVFVGGTFTKAGGILASNIAKWDGSVWTALGDGVVPRTIQSPAVVSALAWTEAGLHVGGGFGTAGGFPAYAFSIWQPAASSQPQATIRVLPDGKLVITWNSLPNATYQIRATTNLAIPFESLSGPILSAGASTSFTNSTTPAAARFYHVEQLSP